MQYRIHGQTKQKNRKNTEMFPKYIADPNMEEKSICIRPEQYVLHPHATLAQ